MNELRSRLYMNRKTCMKLAVSVFVLAFFAGQTLAQESARDYYELGREFLEAGEYEKANEAFKKAQEILDSSTEEIIDMDVPSESISRETPVVEEEKEEVLEEEDLLAKLLREARAAYEKEDLKQAEASYRRALEIAPDDNSIHYNLGVICLKRSDYQSAADEFEAVLADNPRDAEAYYNLGILYESYLNDKTKAIHYYKRYLRYSSDNKKNKEKVKEWIKQLKNPNTP